MKLQQGFWKIGDMTLMVITDKFVAASTPRATTAADKALTSEMLHQILGDDVFVWVTDGELGFKPFEESKELKQIVDRAVLEAMQKVIS